MFSRADAILKKIWRVFNPDEIMARIMRLPKSKEPADRQGLVIIQIDGLGYDVVTSAIEKGRMPRLAKLIRKEGYVLNRSYSGLPSSTPSVQGELFYGVKQCIPAFGFRDSRTGASHNMFEMGFAGALEERLKQQGGQPLLKGGSAYGDIFAGGADEAHFCVSAFGWDQLLRPENIIGFFVSAILHINVFFRSLVLITLELVYGFFDALRALVTGKDATGELGYLPLRVVICVLLRIVVGMGARIDIIRGLPVIHVNFAGYDEQAHHKGPLSGLAKWSLRSIDGAIGGILKAARSSGHRDYEVFIYSDHGQEQTAFYDNEYGMPVMKAINSVFSRIVTSENWKATMRHHRHDWRASLIKGAPPANNGNNTGPLPEPYVHVGVEAMGPVGHIYPPEKLSPSQKQQLAENLVKDANIPAVLYAANGSGAVAVTGRGTFHLPAQGAELIDSAHPFFDSVIRDTVMLCHHPDAGQLIIMGYTKEGRYITFFKEGGSHGGPGPSETAAFTILPGKAANLHGGGEMDVAALRHAALHELGREEKHEPESMRGNQAAKRRGTVRIMTYNVHGCMGHDGKISPERIARAIAEHEPDIVAMQELKADDMQHQAEVIAARLSMGFHYHAPVLLKAGWHGNAVLSRFDIRLVKGGPLPRLRHTPLLEPRGALWVEVATDGHRIQLFNTHLSLLPAEGLLQMEALLGPDWTGSPDIRGPVVLCGDFNAGFGSRACRAADRQLRNAQYNRQKRGRMKTFPSVYPVATVDHVYLGKGIIPVSVAAPATAREKKASDHAPLIVDIKLL